MLLGLPLALAGMAWGVYGAIRGHKATVLRHVADIGQFITLICVLLPLVVTQLIPHTGDMAQCAEPASDLCRYAAAAHLNSAHQNATPACMRHITLRSCALMSFCALANTGTT